MVEQSPGTIIRYADETGDYRSQLISHLNDLDILYGEFKSKMMHGTYDDEVVTLTVSKMTTIMDHLIPKLEGGGQKTERLLKEFEDFRSWSRDILKLKKDITEADRIPDLYTLILKTYHLLNITNIS